MFRNGFGLDWIGTGCFLVIWRDAVWYGYMYLDIPTYIVIIILIIIISCRSVTFVTLGQMLRSDIRLF
jgi:hypothetical protein